MSASKKRKQRRPDQIDVHVGDRIRCRRRALGISQKELAMRLGITVQQLHKYEAGANRIAASRLYDIARALDIGVGDLFAGLDDIEPPKTDVASEVAVAFNRIASGTRQRAVLLLVRSLADDSE